MYLGTNILVYVSYIFSFHDPRQLFLKLTKIISVIEDCLEYQWRFQSNLGIQFQMQSKVEDVDVNCMTGRKEDAKVWWQQLNRSTIVLPWKPFMPLNLSPKTKVRELNKKITEWTIEMPLLKFLDKPRSRSSSAHLHSLILVIAEITWIQITINSLKCYEILCHLWRYWML